jgi:hypothetical protein
MDYSDVTTKKGTANPSGAKTFVVTTFIGAKLLLPFMGK